MFGLGGNPFDIEVEKSTNEKNTSEDWGLILDICDKVSQSPANAKLCVKSIIKRLNHADPHVVLKAITLLDACVNNCGKTFHLEIASRDFEAEYKKLISKSHPIVQQKLKELLKVWAEGEFKSDPQLNLIPSLFTKLKLEGVDFNPPPDMVAKKSPQLSKDPNVAANQQEVEDIAKAIELSLKEKSGSPRTTNTTNNSGVGAGAGSASATGGGTTSSSLYPSTNLGTTSSNPVSAPTEARKVRALYDFEAAEDNELTFLAGEIIHVIDDSDQNWWKGGNQRGEGLFPANFVTADLSVEPEHLKVDPKKVQFQENVAVKPVEIEPEEVEINEEKIDRLLHLLHEADPSDSQHDTQEMIHLEEQVNNMGPLIDAELERVDRKHAQLTQLSADLVEGLNLYHTLMREPDYVMLPKHLLDRYRPTNHSHHMYNGAMPPHPPGMPPYAYPMPHPQGPPGSAPNHDIRPPFMALPPGAPPMALPPQHFAMPPPGMNAMPPPQQMGGGPPPQHGNMPPPGMNMALQQKIEDRGPASIPPQFTPGPGNMPNYGPPGMMQQPGAPFPSPQIATSQTALLGPGGMPPPQNFVPTPTASSHHLM